MPKLKKLNSSKGNLRLSILKQKKLNSPNTSVSNKSLMESSCASENDANIMNTTISPQDPTFAKPTKRKRVRLFNRTPKRETSQELNFSAAFVSSQESSPDISNKKVRRVLNHSDKSATEANFSEVFQETLNSTGTKSVRKNLPMCGETGKIDTLTADVDFSKAFEFSQELVLGSSAEDEPRRRRVLFDCQSQKSTCSETDANFSEMFSQATVDSSSVKPIRKKLPLAPNRTVDGDISSEEHDFSRAFLSTDELELDSMIVKKKRGTLFNDSGKSFYTQDEDADFSNAFSRSTDSTASDRMQVKLSNLFKKMNKSEYTETDDDFSKVFVSSQEGTPEMSTQSERNSMLDEQRESSCSKMDTDSSAASSLSQDASHDLSDNEDDISKTLTESVNSTLTNSVNEVSSQRSSKSDNSTRVSGTSMSSQTLNIDSSIEKENTHNEEVSVSEVFPSLGEAVNEVSNQNFSKTDNTRFSSTSIASQTLGLDSLTEKQNSRNIEVSVSEVFPSMGEVTTNNLMREELQSIRVEVEEHEKSSVQLDAQNCEDPSTLKASNSNMDVAVSETLLISGTSIVSAVNRSVEKLHTERELTGDVGKNRTSCETPKGNSDTEVAVSETLLISGTSIVSAVNRSVEKLDTKEKPTGDFDKNQAPKGNSGTEVAISETLLMSEISIVSAVNRSVEKLDTDEEPIGDVEENRTPCKTPKGNSDTEVAISETLLISGTSIVSAVNRSVEKLDTEEEPIGDVDKNRTPCKTPKSNSDTEVAISETLLISGTSIVSAINRSVEKLDTEGQLIVDVEENRTPCKTPKGNSDTEVAFSETFLISGNSGKEPTGDFTENQTLCNTPPSSITPGRTFNLEMPSLPCNDEIDNDRTRTLYKTDSSKLNADNLEVKGVVSETFVVSKDSTYCISNRSTNAGADTSTVNFVLNNSPVNSPQTEEASTSLLYSPRSPGSEVNVNATRTIIKTDSSVQKPSNMDTMAIDSETFIISKISVVSTSNHSPEKPVVHDSSRGDCTLRNSPDHSTVLEEERLASNVETDLTKTLCEFKPSAEKSNRSETEVVVSETFLMSTDSITPATNRSVKKFSSEESPECSRTPFNSPEDSFRHSTSPETNRNSLCLEATARILQKIVPSASTNEAENSNYSIVVCSQESDFSPEKKPRTVLFNQLGKSTISEVGPDFSRAFLQQDNITPTSVVKKKLNNFFTDMQTSNIAGTEADFSKAFVSTQECSLEISTLKKKTFPFCRESTESIDLVRVSTAKENTRYTNIMEEDNIVPGSNNSKVLSERMLNSDLSLEKQTNSEMEVDFSEVFFSMGESTAGNLIREETPLLVNETEKTNVGLLDTCNSSSLQKCIPTEMEKMESEPSIPIDPLISSKKGSSEISALVEGETPRRRSSRIQNRRNSQSPKDSSAMENSPKGKETLTRKSIDSNTSEAHISPNASTRNDSQQHSSSEISVHSSRASSSRISNHSSQASSSKTSNHSSLLSSSKSSASKTSNHSSLLSSSKSSASKTSNHSSLVSSSESSASKTSNHSSLVSSSKSSASKTSNHHSLVSSSKNSASITSNHSSLVFSSKSSASKHSVPNSRDSIRNQSLDDSFRSWLRVSRVSSQESLPQSSIRSRKSSSTTIFSLSKMDTYSNDDSIYEKEPSPTRNVFKKPKAPARNKDLISKPNFPQFDMYCNMNFYNVLIKMMEPKFGIYTNSKVVKLMKFISEMVKEITYSKEDPNENVNLFKRKLFDYGIVNTHFDFNMFVLNYLPIRFKNRALPMWRPYGLPSIIKFDPNTLHDPIG